MSNCTIALFGEAEKGEYSIAYACHNPIQLLERYGNPPPQSRGIYFALQALLYECTLFYFRVREEGFSRQDYLLGLDCLQRQQIVPQLAAICLPGVGNSEIIEALNPICAIYHSILITNEADMYDYLTQMHL